MMHSILKSILEKRGIQNFESFLNPKIKDSMPNPYDVPFMDKAVERFIEAVHKKEKIGLFGDYDVDGATSVSLFLKVLKDVAFEVYIPNRLTEGYGPNKQAMDYFKSKDISLVICVDCGTKSTDILAYAKSLGMDMIVLDHHLSDTPLSQDAIIVNPNAHEAPSPSLKNLCAAGVTFLFLSCLLKTWPHYKEPLLQNLDLVALGTVCDIMPLIGFNRALVKQGLKVMNQHHNHGLTALSSISGIEGEIHAQHLGFYIGPRINAGGRIGESNLGYSILSTHSRDKAIQIATQLNKLNIERREVQQQILDEAINEIEKRDLNKHNVILLGQKHWHPGVIGVVAGKIKEQYQKPTLIVGFHEDDVGIGSGRAPENYSVTEFLDEAVTAQKIIAGGGHSCAFGFKLHFEQIEPFYEFLIEKTASMIIAPQQIDIDVRLPSFKELSLDLLNALSQMAPFGQKNPEPVFIIENVTLSSSQVLKNQHLKCELQDQEGQKLKGIFFNNKKVPEGTFNLVARLDKNVWRGEETLLLHVVEFRQQESESQAISKKVVAMSA